MESWANRLSEWGRLVLARVSAFHVAVDPGWHPSKIPRNAANPATHAGSAR